MSTAIWNAAAGTPTATHRIPVDTSGAGTPTMYTVQQVADLETSVGTSVNALGSIAVNTAIDLALGGFVSATIGANLTLSFTNPPAGGTEFTLVLTNGGAFTVTWPGAVTWAGATAPTLTASGTDVLRFTSGNGGTNWYGWHERDEVTAPGGSTTQLQYNNAGAFGGMSGTAWDDTNRAETRTGATITTSNPVQSFTQTWNAGAVTFTGWKLNVTDTASASGSVLFDLQTGGSSALYVTKLGHLRGYFGSAASPTFSFVTQTGTGMYTGDGHLRFARGGSLEFTLAGSGLIQLGGANDCNIQRDAANIVARRNGTNAQTNRIYGTYTDASNYERGFIRFNAGTMEIGNEFAGSGSARSIRIVQSGGSYANGIILQVNSTTNLSFYGYGLFNGSGVYSSQSALTVTTPDAIGFSANAEHTTVKAGSAWVYAGNNANGGNVYLDGGAGYGTGTDGNVIVGNTKGNLVVRSGLICESQFRLMSYTVATLPSAATAGALIYVTDETGGATVAFSDGTNWRRVTDRSVCS